MFMIALKRNSRRGGLLAALLLGGALAVSGAATAGMQELVRDTQRTAESGGNMTMVWWMPQQFWEESLKANPAMPEAARAQVLSALADYNIIALLRAKPGATGLADVQPKVELFKNARVEVNGKLIEPMVLEQISPVAQLLLAQLKPAMAAMAGQVGQALEFVVYPAKGADGKLQFDALQPGTLKVSLYDANFSWRLPLGSLLPAKLDKKTGEEFPGNYQFNPFTGDKLGTR
jgi:hypothetical protein